MPHSVLVIDDSLPFHKLVKAYLEPDRMTIHSVHDGEAGLAAAEKHRPSLILLDIDMPRLDGFEVCRRLKANPATKSIPLIFLTASSMLNDTVSGLEMGASDYISKPFKPQQFRARIRATLRTKDYLDSVMLIDESSGLWNRAYFDEHVGPYVALAKRWGATLACIIAELDNYSGLIASHGQPAADDMVRAIARIFLSQRRAEDLVSRFAPSKFAILVTDCNRRGADHLAMRLRAQIERHLHASLGHGAKFTCSFGIADTQIADATTLVDRAEAVLRHPARRDSNRVVIARALREKAAACWSRRVDFDENIMHQQILVIDDSKTIHPLIKAILSDEPVEVHSALDAKYGMVLAASIRPDLILLDIDMPGMDGFEVCKHLKADRETASVPIIFLSSHSAVAEKVRGLGLGAMDYVTKPFNRAELMARVRASLRIKESIRALEEKATIDPLTGLGNRAAFDQRLEAEVCLHVRTRNPLACILMDVDRFKRINDTFGHPFGDKVLKQLAAIITDLCRTEDVACRYGGEEFAIVTPNTTAVAASVFAERLRVQISKARFIPDPSPSIKPGTSISVTASFGVADSVEQFDRSMVQRADDALYQSKRDGRDRVSLAASSVGGQAAAA